MGGNMTDINHLFPEVVRELIPYEPTARHKSGNELRFGNKESLSINLEDGTWYDFENQKGGGILDFIMDQTGIDSKAKAMKWLEDKGIKPKSEPPKQSKSQRKEIASYFYADEHGELSYIVKKYSSNPRFQQFDASGNPGIKDKNITPLPYRLPEMLAQQNTILIVEGEKDVDNLYGIGLTATTNSGGAKNFSDSLVQWFANRVIIVLPDNDEVGQEHAQIVAQKLHPVATSIRIVNLPGLGPKGDVSDWIKAGGTKSQLIDICKAAPFWEPPSGVLIPTFQEQITDYYSPLVYFNDKGKPLPHIDNLKEILNRLGVTTRYNVISKEDEILIPGKSFTMDNKANATLAWIESECSRFQFSTGKISDFLTYIADQNPYNPVATWIESKPWDGVERLPDLYDTVWPENLSDNDLKETLIKRWMIAAVAAAFSPNGVASPGILVFQGEQYLGKTKWFKSLVPEELEVLKDGLMLDPTNKDSVEQACSFWLVELGELDATFKKSDIAALKAFITNRSDVFRRAYAKKKSQFARRTVFFGSVNNKAYLNDPTGNRRFWTIECKDLNHSHNLDMQQIWAEVLHLYRQGESYFLTQNELEKLNDHNEDFTVSDPIAERLASRLNWDDPMTLWTWRSATEILIEVGIDKPQRADATTAGIYIRKRNNNQAKRGGDRKLLAPRAISSFGV